MDKLELSLKGSQINLATRDKPSGTRYNHHTRPESATVLNNYRDSFFHRKLSSKRPQSADTSLFHNKHKYFASDYTENKNNPASSTTNLYKLLIAEPVRRSWTRKDSDSSLGTCIKNKANFQKMNNPHKSDESSVDEDTESVTSVQHHRNSQPTANNLYTNNFNNDPTQPFTPVNRPSSYFNQNISVREKLTNIENAPLKSSLTKTWIGETTERKKPDLPGRVSFSTNDVYEIDYSDYDDRDTPSSEHSAERPSQTPEKSDDVLDKPACCASNCSNKFQNIPTISFTDQTSEASRVIEDYKKEIDDINHRHQLEYHMAEMKAAKTQELNNSPSYYNNGKEVEKALTPNYVDHKNVELYKSSETMMEEYYNCIAEIENCDKDNGGKIENTSPPPNFNDNLSFSENVSSSSDTLQENLKQPIKPATVKHTQPDSSNSVIKNYLKVKFQKLNPTTKVGQATKKFPTTLAKRSNIAPPFRAKPVSATTQRRKPSNLKKSKSIPCLKEDSSLDEFHIDKVVSWMSSHDDTLSETADGSQQSFSHQYQSNGRTTKSDFERNEFKCDQNDDDAMAETSFDDYVAVIKDIENSSKNTGFDELKTDVDFRLNTLLKSMETPDSALELETPRSQSKQDIFSYLDNVDSSCDKAMKSVKYTNSLMDEDELNVPITSEADIIEEVPKISDLLLLPNHLLAKRIVSLSLRANELSSAIQLSKEHVANVRADRQKTLRMEKLQTQNRLKDQKKQYEDIVARHQSFIEQLIKDKSELCDKVTQLTRRIDSQTQAWDHRLKTEIERAKETVLAGEKIRREKWVRDNTKKIKDLTVKGLELEINKMTTNHQREIAEIQNLHKQEKQDALDCAKLKYEQQEKQIRDSYAHDREGAIEKERLAIKERFQNQMEDERKLFEEQKHRLQKELEKEKQEFYKEIKGKEHQFDVKKEQIVNEHIEMLEQIKYDFKEKLKQRELKHQNELTKLQEQFESDFSIWKREFEASTKLRECEKENLIRQQCRLERDHQIDAIVNKVDCEAIKSQQDFEVKLSRIKEKYETEIRDLEFSEKSIKEKFIETRSKLAESDANIQNLQATVKQLEIQLNHTQKICDGYTKDKENMKENARKEIQSELKAMQKEHNTEIQRIYARVQQAIEKKDQTIEVLQTDNSTLKERCLKLETVIRQQRKDYCTK